MYETIRHELVDGVSLLTLNRPQRKNALDLQMRGEMRDLVEGLRYERGLKALVIAGAGGNFCSGGDLGTLDPEAPPDAGARRQRLVDLHPLVTALLTFDRPVIAAVNGVAYGAGLGLALTADFILAGDDARFCAAFGRVGAIPDFGTFYTLPRTVGLRRAKEIIFSAREFGAGEALRMGLAYERHPSAEVVQRACELAARFRDASPLVLSVSKRALDVSLESSLQAMLMHESDGQGIALSSAYHAEALRRFHAKEPAMLRWPAVQALD